MGLVKYDGRDWIETVSLSFPAFVHDTHENAAFPKIIRRDVLFSSFLVSVCSALLYAPPTHLLYLGLPSHDLFLSPLPSFTAASPPSQQRHGTPGNGGQASGDGPVGRQHGRSGGFCGGGAGGG